MHWEDGWKNNKRREKRAMEGDDERSELGYERVIDFRVVRPFRLQRTNSFGFPSVPVFDSTRREDAH